MSVPVRSDAQRADALAAALASRQERSRLRSALKSRDLTAAAVIAGAPDNALWGGVRVSWLLECVPGIGSVRAARIMSTLEIAPSRRVQGLGDRQRAALLEELATHG